MSNGLLYIAGLIALALAALFAVPYFIDWNGYRGVFEEEATRILGREVRVGGNVNVRLLPSPFVRFDKLKIAGPAGQPFFSAESFTMRLSVPPLLKGILEANEIALKRPILRLALDADGGGNWRALRITPGTLPFVPADVALQSVKIDDGMISLRGPKGTDVGFVDGLRGEFKADSIEGPYAFRGTVGWEGVPRQVRFATDAMDASGNIRFKAIVRGTKLANSYTLDGRLLDLSGRPRVEGDLTARIELESSAPLATPDGEPVLTSESGNAGEHPLVDFKATLAGDATGMRLDDIALSFERIGQPQLITGAASASWSQAMRVELALASRWLDLDRIAGGNGTAGPIETARSFVAAAMQTLPSGADTRVQMDLDQATLGGEAVSGIRLDVERDSGALILRDLRAGLPGGAKLVLDGAVAGVSDTRSFQGELALRGTSLTRFLTWAAKDPAVAEAVRSDGPFSLQGRFGLSNHGFDLVEAGAEIGGTPFTGEVHYSSAKRTRLAVVLEGQEIDGTQLWPVGISYLKGMLAGTEADAAQGDAAEAKSGPKRWFDTATSDLSVRVRAGRLKTGRQPLNDVDMDLAVEQGRLSLRSCKFTAANGLALDLNGDVDDVAGEPRGVLRSVVAVPAREAFDTLVTLLDLPQADAQAAKRYGGLVPMRLAGTLTLGGRGKGTSDISVDGSLQGGRVIANARLDGGLADWRAAAADLALTVTSADVVATLDSLAARPVRTTAQQGALGGEIFFRAKGRPADGLLATATVKADGLYLAYDGGIQVPAEGDSKLDGDVRVSSRQFGDVLAIAGLGSGGALRDIPIVGTIKLTSSDHALELKPKQLAVGGSMVAGSLALAHPDEGPAIVTAQLKVDQASIPALLGAVLDRKSVAAAETADGEPATEGKTIWPEFGFDFAALDGVEGKLGIGFGKLSLAPGMSMANAQVDVALEPGKLSLTKLEGKVLGGNLFATAALERVPGGANVAGDVRLTGAKLQHTTKKTDAGGGASLQLEFSGRGATPGGLIAVATGKGELTIGEMSIRVPTPLAVVETSEAVLTGAAGGSGDELVAALRKQIVSSPVTVGPRTIPIAIGDGAAQLAVFSLPSPAGETRVETTVDLASLTVDSSWQLVPKAPDIVQPDRPGKGALPPVSVLYVGPLKDAWSLEPRISAEPLERELAIRRMELDAEQLERLHQLDAQRARQEDERRKAAEADEDARATTGAPAPVDRTPPPQQPAPTSGIAPQPIGPVPVVPDAVAPWQGQAPVPGSTANGQLPELGGTTVIPDVPGLQPDVPVGLPGDPTATTTAANPALDAVPPDAVPAPTETYRPRRAVRRQVPAGEQVLRSLQNTTN
jgi:uncharacterized protein involved in outer membrane biogenesis